MPETPLDLDFVRGLYPDTCWQWAFFENAGGSFVPKSVIERVTEYMRETQVQPGAPYEPSAEAARRMARGQRLMAEMIGAGPDEVVIGPSTTMNVFVLSKAMAGLLAPGDQVIVTNLDHEANIGAWRRLQDIGMTVTEWPVDPATGTLDTDALDGLLGEKTRLVCFSHCSNVTGAINDVAAITRRAHGAGAMVCVDGVAYAPHRAVDVKALGVDFYLMSLYKLYGPHVSLLYARKEHIERLAGQNHFFLDGSGPLKLNPGGPNHELTAAFAGVAEYLDALADHHLDAPPNSFQARVEAVFGLIAAHEAALAAPFLDFLRSKPSVRLFGPATADPAVRVPVFSFTVDGRKSADIPPLLEPGRVAIRHGDFYARRLMGALAIEDADDGVVRASMVHYNTDDEVRRLIEGLDRAL